MKYLLIPLLLLLQACGVFDTPPPPETATKRDVIVEQLALAESDYQQVIKVLTQHRAEGRLSSSEIRKIDEAFDNFEKYRNFVKTALDAGDILSAESNYGKAIGALQILRDIVAEQGAARPLYGNGEAYA